MVGSNLLPLAIPSGWTYVGVTDAEELFTSEIDLDESVIEFLSMGILITQSGKQYFYESGTEIPILAGASYNLYYKVKNNSGKDIQIKIEGDVLDPEGESILNVSRSTVSGTYISKNQGVDEDLVPEAVPFGKAGTYRFFGTVHHKDFWTGLSWSKTRDFDFPLAMVGGGAVTGMEDMMGMMMMFMMMGMIMPMMSKMTPSDETPENGDNIENIKGGT